MHKSILLALAALVAMTPAGADPEAFLAAPERVVYEIQDGGTLVSWDAPVYAGSLELSRYVLYITVHMAGPTPYEVLSSVVVDAGQTSYFDADVTNAAFVVYHVTAVYDNGVESRMSEIVARAYYPHCSVIRPDLHPVMVGIHKECLYPMPV